MNIRFNRLRLEMKNRGLECLFVTNLKNIYYLTGFSLSAGSILVTKDHAKVFLDKRYLEMALERAESEFSVHDSSDLLPLLLAKKSVAIEAESVSVEQLARWKTMLKNKKLVHTFDLIKGLRRLKDSQEISKIKKACAITKKVLRIIPSLISVGMSEIELSRRIQIECLRLGADGMAFETIVGFGSNTSIPHHHPTQRKFRTGDLVQIDMGAMVDHYCSDFSRIYQTGEMSPEFKNAFLALKKAKKLVEKMMKPGVSTHKLDREARRVLKTFSYDEEFCHALGHGLGLDIHEGVTISMKRPDAKLKKGDVITIEPGLYFPKKFGIRIEDTHIVV